MTLPAFRSANPRLASEYDNMLACIRCGLCLTSCPTYVLSMDESESPRGRVGMARALAEGHLEISPRLVEHELNCLVCDACSAVCPAGVHMDPLQVVLRAALEQNESVGRGDATAIPTRGRRAWSEHLAGRPASGRRRAWSEQLLRRVVFGWLFMDMRRFRLVARLLWLYQRLGAQWLARHAGLLKLLGLNAAERLLPQISDQFVVPKGEVYPSSQPATTPGALFAGCVMSTALADVDRATIRVLQRAGYSVGNPAGQACCGALHAHGGDLPRALQLARANIAAFERTEGPIVVNSAGCGAMLKDYAHHLRTEPHWAKRASVFSGRVQDLSEALADRVLPVGSAVEGRVVYQDACHLLHAQRISRQPRSLLRHIPGLELAEIDEAGLCCGSAGVYNVTNPRESRQLQQRKLDHALAVDPAVIVTANPGCLLQLKSGLAERGSHVQVQHLAEVLDVASTP